MNPSNNMMKFKLTCLLPVLMCGILLSANVLISHAQAAEQPHMVNALEALKRARHQLEIAEADKGGHRVRAIGIVDNAIAEVEAGIAAGN